MCIANFQYISWKERRLIFAEAEMFKKKESAQLPKETGVVRLTLAEETPSDLKKFLEENDPQTEDACIRWLRYAFLFRARQAPPQGIFDDALKAKSIQVTRKALSLLKGMKNPVYRIESAKGVQKRRKKFFGSMTEAFDFLEPYCSKLQEITAYQSADEGLRLCHEDLQNIQRVIESMDDDIAEFVDAAIAKTEKERHQDWIEGRRNLETMMTTNPDQWQQEYIEALQAKKLESDEHNTIMASIKMEAMFLKRLQTLLQKKTLPIHRLNGRPVETYAYIPSTEQNQENAPWIVEQYPGERSDIYCLRSSKDPRICVPMSAKDFHAVVLEGESGFMKYVRRAQKNAEAEKNAQKKKKLADFDLLNEMPENTKIVHVHLFPKNDPSLGKVLLGSMISTVAFQKKYKENIVSWPIVLSDNPQEDLPKELGKIIAEYPGPKHFVIDIYSHGSKDSLSFPIPFTAEHIASISDQFKESDNKFTYKTIACYGAGLEEGMKEQFRKKPHLTSKINLFVETQGNVVNYFATRQKDPVYSFNNGDVRREQAEVFNFSLSLLYFTKALLSGKTYGEAFQISDQEVKFYSFIDGSAYLDGEKISLHWQRQHEDRNHTT